MSDTTDASPCRQCARPTERLTLDDDRRVERCEHCGWVQPVDAGRAPLDPETLEQRADWIRARPFQDESDYATAAMLDDAAAALREREEALRAFAFVEGERQEPDYCPDCFHPDRHVTGHRASCRYEHARSLLPLTPEARHAD
jgi:hypothetical protein